jgi:hypothetical protein
MSRCYPSVVVGACCARFGPQSQLRRPEQQTAASWSRGSSSSFAVMSDGTRATHLGNPGLWCRVSCTSLGGPGALVG